MQRQIKFKAWNIQQKKFIEIYAICYELNGDINIQTKDFKSHGYPLTYAADENIIMQYTGIKDAKKTETFPEGQEIYEGDIIKNPLATEPEEKGFYVEFRGYKWVAYNVNYPDIGWYSLEFSSDLCERFEVIGNIYENPELIKK